MRIVFLVLVLAVYINAAPTEHFESEEEEAKVVIDELINAFEEDSRVSDNPFASAFIKSIDKDCILNKYKEHKILHLITLEGLKKVKLTKTGGKHVLLNVAAVCTKKSRPLLGFVFENFFSFNDLIGAFRNDEPFKTYLDELSCYNNYAVRHNYIDAATYPNFEHSLTEKTEGECDEKIKELRDMLQGALDGLFDGTEAKEFDCYKTEFVKLAERVFFKFVLLVPAKVTVEQKSQAKTHFIDDILETLDQGLSCNVVLEPQAEETTAEEENKVEDNEA